MPRSKEPNSQVSNSQSLFDQLSKEEKIIFLAGVFDGEGSFGMWSTGKGRPRHLCIKVETTDSDMVARFKEVFGGTFFTSKRRKENWKHTFVWKQVRDEAWKTLEQMIPYMCLRRRMKFNGLVKPTGYGCEDWGSYLQKQTREQTTYVGRTETSRREDG